MKPTKEQIEAYKMMAKHSPDTMESQIKKNLVETCQKFVGNEDKFDRCMKYLVSCARELLDGKNGDLADDVCYRICRDYFNDEVWRKEDEEEAKKKKVREDNGTLVYIVGHLKFDRPMTLIIRNDDAKET